MGRKPQIWLRMWTLILLRVWAWIWLQMWALGPLGSMGPMGARIPARRYPIRTWGESGGWQISSPQTIIRQMPDIRRFKYKKPHKKYFWTSHIITLLSLLLSLLSLLSSLLTLGWIINAFPDYERLAGLLMFRWKNVNIQKTGHLDNEAPPSK